MAAMSYLFAGHGGPAPTRSGAGYLPIEEHGIVGDLRTVALVGTDGTVDWYCPSRFDAPSLFGALLDARKGGYFSLRSRSSGRPKQLYLPDTNILLTRFQGAEAVGEVIDFMVPFDYGRAPHTVDLVADVGAVFSSPAGRCVLRPAAAFHLLGPDDLGCLRPGRPHGS
jgi:GH15 family glucan-1,4-alpha-glucosidase